MMKSVLVFALLLILSFSSEAGTHCLPGETDYFSCEATPSKKVVSICGKEGEWLQYRFGKLENPEFLYPKDKAGSISKFKVAIFNKYGFDELSFAVGNTTYRIGLQEEHEELEAGKVPPKGGIEVDIGKSKYIEINCRAPVKKNYANKFRDLVYSLQQNKWWKEPGRKEPSGSDPELHHDD